jgi:hypothetical protein
MDWNNAVSRLANPSRRKVFENCNDWENQMLFFGGAS